MASSSSPISRRHATLNVAAQAGWGSQGSVGGSTDEYRGAKLVADSALIDEEPARVGKSHLRRQRAAASPNRRLQLANKPLFLEQVGARLAEDAEDEEDEDEGEVFGGEPDSVELILWYHTSESATRPIYSVDARQLHNAPSPTANNGQQLNKPQFLAEPDSLVPVSSRPLMGTANSRLSSSPNIGAAGRRQMETSQLHYNNNGRSGQNGSRPSESNTIAGQVEQSQNVANTSSLLLNVAGGSARHYVMAKLSSRVRLMIRGTRAYLIINKVQTSDSGQYKCRVDYKLARTRYQLNELAVISEFLVLVALSPKKTLKFNTYFPHSRTR